MSTSKLAIDGGEPVRKTPWPAQRRGDDLTRQKLIKALEGDNWSNGELVKEFEQRFASFLRAKHALLTVNATAALQLLLLAYDIGPNDEVIIPALTFASVAQAVLECGAVPVVCDVEPDTCCISATTIQAAITNRTRAVIPTHIYCTQCDMPPIMELAQRHNLKVIEDCAHVVGTVRDGRSAGTFGHAAIFSFNQKKHLACGEGGCLVTDDDSIFERATRLHNFDAPLVGSPRRIQRMCKVSEFQAAVLLGQIEPLQKRLSKIESQAEQLRQHFQRDSRVKMLTRLPDTDLQTFYQVCFYVPGITNVKRFQQGLSAELGMPITTTYIPLDINPAVACRGDRQFQSTPLRSVAGSCSSALLAHTNAVKFPGFYLGLDDNASNEVITAIEKLFSFHH